MASVRHIPSVRSNVQGVEAINLAETDMKTMFDQRNAVNSTCGGVCNCDNLKEENERAAITIDDLLCRDGPFLKTLQFATADEDSKLLLDRPIKASPETVLEAFYRLPDHSAESIANFLEIYFDEAGTDLELWIPPDLPIEDPDFIQSVSLSPIEASTAHEAIKILGCLGRKVKGDSAYSFERRTLLDISHGFIVPGGRFREAYYWDSYWILRGLLITAMYDTARGMLENWCELISKYGFIPNGLRRYYLDRSQPPLFSLMISNYYDATGDEKFLEKVYPYVQQEYAYWMNEENKHVVTVEFEDESFEVKNVITDVNEMDTTIPGRYVLNRYYSERDEPRPESYKEDYTMKAANSSNPQYANYLMQCLRAGGESGWDFSSRWYRISERSRWSLANIDTLNVLPMDLNSILYLMERKLSDWAALQTQKSHEEKQMLQELYSKAASSRRVAMRALMWDAEIGRWCDYLCFERSRLAIPNLASVWPLWAGLTEDEKEMEGAVNFLTHHSGLWREWGLAPTAINSGQQWDLPNGWPPLTQVALEFLITCPLPEARLCGIDMLERCLASIIQGKITYGCFFEKYSTEVYGSRGSGGEYVTQVGFGWTNAVVIEWLKYKSCNYDLETVKNILLSDFNPTS